MVTKRELYSTLVHSSYKIKVNTLSLEETMSIQIPPPTPPTHTRVTPTAKNNNFLSPLAAW